MQKLVIIEAPNKAHTISKILGQDYTVRATVGHIIDLAKGKGSDIGVDIKNGFKPRYEILPDKKDKVKAILDAARSSSEIIIASDDDREGEAIAFHVKSQLDKLGKPIYRAAFNEITKKAVLNAIQNPRPMNEELFNAQQARRVLDRIVGFMVSPYLSRKLGDQLSAGRVQSVALRLIVEREREIETFIPEEYFVISANLKKPNDIESFIAKLAYDKLTDAAKASKIAEALTSSKFSISSIKSNKKNREAPPPLTTSTLQQEASAKFKFDAERTMSAAQALYEQGIVTYIRTDSTRNSPESVESVRKYIQSIGKAIPDSPNLFKNKDAAQDAHEAIRPTDVSLHPKDAKLEEDHKKIYELVWRMFVSSQMTDAVYDTVSVTIKSSAGYELKAEGKILVDAGWLDIAKPFIKSETDVMLPKLTVGDSVILAKGGVVNDKKKTQPPSRFNDGTLVKELDRREIGRPSTYASIISRISNRKYVKKTAKGFQPTELGSKVVDDLKGFFSFMDYKYTAMMEKKLDDISQGKLGYLEMLTEFFNGFKIEFQSARGNQGMDTGLLCPNCNSNMVVRKSSYGYFAGCVKYPECKGIIGINLVDGKVVVKSGGKYKVEQDIICPECNSGMVLREDGRFGPFYSCSNYPRCKGKRKVPFGKKCPECGSELFATLFSGRLKLACMGYPNCKHVEDLPKDSQLNWVNPETIIPPRYSSKVEKLLKP
jgi:DNA topoisomerase-1